MVGGSPTLAGKSCTILRHLLSLTFLFIPYKKSVYSSSYPSPLATHFDTKYPY